MRVGDIPQLRSATPAFKSKSRAEVLKRRRSLVDYGEAPARKRRGDVTASAPVCYPDDSLSSADRSKTSKELYTMEHRFQRFRGDRWRSESHRTVDILDRRETTCKANKPPDCRFNPSKNYRIYVCDRCHKPKSFQKKGDDVRWTICEHRSSRT